jgi:hypothetical protein
MRIEHIENVIRAAPQNMGLTTARDRITVKR